MSDADVQKEEYHLYFAIVTPPDSGLPGPERWTFVVFKNSNKPNVVRNSGLILLSRRFPFNDSDQHADSADILDDMYWHSLASPNPPSILARMQLGSFLAKDLNTILAYLDSPDLHAKARVDLPVRTMGCMDAPFCRLVLLLQMLVSDGWLVTRGRLDYLEITYAMRRLRAWVLKLKQQGEDDSHDDGPSKSSSDATWAVPSILCPLKKFNNYHGHSAWRSSPKLDNTRNTSEVSEFDLLT